MVRAVVRVAFHRPLFFYGLPAGQLPRRAAADNMGLDLALTLQELIRFDTTNPPGNEAACASYINSLLTRAGIETTVLAKSPARPNLIARLPGQGQAPPLLLYGHLDVVTTAAQKWQNSPFEGLAKIAVVRSGSVV